MMATRLSRTLLKGAGIGASLRQSCGVTLNARAPTLSAYAAGKRSLHGSAIQKRATIADTQHVNELPNEQFILPSKTKKVNEIKIPFPDGERLSLSARWLRDHCHCRECVNQDTLQRSFESFTNNDRTALDVQPNEDGVEITWKETGHISTYPWAWLRRNMKQELPPIKRTFFDSSIASNPPSVHYDEVMSSDAGVGKWTALIAEHGFSFVDGCPATPEATERLLERIAFIRITHYGGFYDFTADLTHKDTAYTNLALPAHTDNTYFTDPSGLQMFHLLSHTSDSAAHSSSSSSISTNLGGTSLLVDGFSCAAQLKAENFAAYEILAKTPVNWHASGNEGITITPSIKFPVFNHDPSTGELIQLRWNNDDRASMPTHPAPGVSYDDWFEAARLWNQIITRPKNEYWEQLKPGRPLVFDNWRVMHARSAFTGKRRMAGGYVNRDDYVSRYWNTNFSKEKVLSRIV